MLSEWIGEPEFNRWYIKWELADWIRATIGAALMSAINPIYYALTARLESSLSAGAIGFGLALLSVCLLVVIFKIRRKPEAIPVPSPLELRKGLLRWRNNQLKQVANQNFRNQEVVLDGFEYIDCTFDAVTFVYNGSAPTAISGKRTLVKLDPANLPNISFAFANPIAGTVATIFQSLGFLHPKAQMEHRPAPVDLQ